MSISWVYPETQPFQVQGRDLSEDNFAQEERTSQEILIREALQNPIDARDTNSSSPVRVAIKILKLGSYDDNYLKQIITPEYESRLEAAGGDPIKEVSDGSVLVLEDFGTTGLEGAWNDANADGPGENWNAFWLREGEGAKSTASNGRAGQGKITYYRIGAARAVLGFTIRKSDGKKLLMGRSAFRRVYPFQGKKYLRHSFWCIDSELPTPLLDDEQISRFVSAFNLKRTVEPGLSLVIPFPRDFDPKAAIRTIISDFYYPIACSRLELEIGDTKFSASNIESIAQHVFPDEVALESRSSFTRGFREMVRGAIQDSATNTTPVVLKEGCDDQ